MDKFLKFFRAVIKSVDAEKMTLQALVSTGKADREGDIIEPESFKKRLKTYKEHPVLLSSHSYSDLRKQIGECVKIEVTEEGVLATFKYYVGEGNPEADWAWVLGQKGIASFSVGFIGHQVEWIKEKFKDDQGNTLERITGRRFKEIELLEISQVVVPCNAGALQLSIGQAKEEAELGELVAKGFQDGSIKEMKMDAVLKPEETDDYIRIPIRSKGDFKDESIRTVTISESEGIEALTGKLKEGDDNTHIMTCLFKKEKGWTMEKAKKWGEDHKEDLKKGVKEKAHYSEVLLGEGSAASQAADSTPAPQEKAEGEVFCTVAKGAIEGILNKKEK